MQQQVEAAKAGSLKLSSAETEMLEADKKLARAEEDKAKVTAYLHL